MDRRLPPRGAGAAARVARCGSGGGPRRRSRCRRRDPGPPRLRQRPHREPRRRGRRCCRASTRWPGSWIRRSTTTSGSTCTSGGLVAHAPRMWFVLNKIDRLAPDARCPSSRPISRAGCAGGYRESAHPSGLRDDRRGDRRSSKDAIGAEADAKAVVTARLSTDAREAVADVARRRSAWRLDATSRSSSRPDGSPPSRRPSPEPWR